MSLFPSPWIVGLLVTVLVTAPWPRITKQISILVENGGGAPQWERHITVENRNRQAVWFWIECEEHLTSTAIGLVGRHTSEFVFPDIPPGERCSINHWEIQRSGKSPEEWIP